MPGNPHNPVIEASALASRQYSPDNALRVMEWYDGLADLVAAVASMLDAQGAKNTEEFFMYPAAGEFARGLGAQFRRYGDVCDAARAAFHAAHADDIERIRNPQRGQERWDVAANRE